MPRQFGEYKGKIPPKDFGNLCMNVASEFNKALLIMQNNSIGSAAILAVIDREYEFL